MSRAMQVRPVLLVAALFALGGCRTFVVKSHTRVPVEKLAFEKTLVVVDIPAEDGSERARRLGENALARSLAVLNAVPSYRLFESEGIGSLDDVVVWARNEGFDGLLVMRFDDATMREFSASSSNTFWNAFAAAEAAVDIRVETTVISTKKGWEVFACLIERRDAWPLWRSVPVVARAVAKQLRAEGLLDPID